MTDRPDYGLDAPGVVRNLFLVGAAGALVGIAGAADVPFVRPFTGVGLGFCLSFTATALWMVYASKVGKLRARERLLDRLPWTGTERVLDVGCGRGLMLIGAAKRLTAGRATGIDLWQTEDLSGNAPDATLLNARREGVADRVTVTTGDMRSLPFADGAFDVVLSCWAIHNVYDKAGRGTAVREIARVLTPGGAAVIKDIRHVGEYTREFQACGCNVTRVTWRVTAVVAAVVTFGALRPGTILVRKGRVLS